MQREIIDHSLKEPYIRIRKSHRVDEESTSDWHFHEDVEILWVQKGTKDIYISNRLYRLKRDDVIFINEYVPHKTKSPRGSKTLLLQFNTREFTSGVTLSEKSPDFFLFDENSRAKEWLLKALFDIEEEYEIKDTGFEKFIQSYIYKIIAVFYRGGVLRSPTDAFSGEKKERLLPAMEYVKKHYAENISLEDVSSLLSLNKSYFCRLFKDCTGMSFTDYLYKTRLGVAENLLLHGNKTITEVAYEVGFSSPAYFTKIFRDYKGYTPSFYKKLQRR